MPLRCDSIRVLFPCQVSIESNDSIPKVLSIEYLLAFTCIRMSLGCAIVISYNYIIKQRKLSAKGFCICGGCYL